MDNFHKTIVFQSKIFHKTCDMTQNIWCFLERSILIPFYFLIPYFTKSLKMYDFDIFQNIYQNKI